MKTSVRVEIFLYNYLAVEYFIEFYISSNFSAHFFNHFIGGNKLYQEVTVTGLFYMAVIYSK